MKKIDQVKATRHEAKDFEWESERWARFGEWLKERRTDLRMTQIEAGRKAGMSRVQWARLEAGEATKYATIPRIARALEYNTESEIAQVYRLAGFATDQEPAKVPPQLAHFSDLPRELQEDVARYVQRLYELDQLKKEKRAKR